jgi:DNA-binding transcriptional ArsR family regulator
MERRPATPEEIKAIAHPLRLRILRLCLDESLTNKQLAERLGKDPATLLHHVRTLERTGFLAAEPERRGARNARERPYRSTGKSWTLDTGLDQTGLMAVLDAFRAEFLESPVPVSWTRMVLRLHPDDLREFTERLTDMVEEYRAKSDPAAPSYGFLLAGHRQADPALRTGEADAENREPA